MSIPNYNAACSGVTITVLTMAIILILFNSNLSLRTNPYINLVDAYNAVSSASDPLQLTVVTDANTLKSTDAIRVTSKLKNISGQRVVLPQIDPRFPEAYISVEVVHESGVPIFFIEPALAEKPKGPASSTLDLAPGQELSFTVILNETGLGAFGYTNPADVTSLKTFSGRFSISAKFTVGVDNLPTGGDADVFVGTISSAAQGVSIVNFENCLQDDSSKDTLQINSTTGDYEFRRCGDALSLQGTGSIIKRGSTIILQHYGADRRVLAAIDGSTNKGSATLQVLSLGRTFNITDRNTSNNSCSCQ